MPIRKSLMGLICVLAVTAMSGGAYAKTIYVSTKGDDKNNGSVNAPLRTISQAAKNVSPGDVVIVKSGTYNESVFIPKGASGTAGKYVTFRSDAPRGAKINAPENKPGIMTFANYLKIDGFEVSGGAISAEMSHHIEITNNEVHDSPKAGITVHRSEFVLVEGNRSYKNSSHAATSGISIHVPQNVSGDTTTQGYRIIVRNNVSHNNVQSHSGNTDGNGIIFDDFLLRNLTANADGDKYRKNYPGMKPYKFPGLIENNIVYGNGGAGIRVYATDNILIRNNTAYHNSTDPDHKKKSGEWLGELQNMSASNNVWVNNIGVADVKIHKNAKGISSVSFKDWPSRNVTWVNNLTYTDGKPGNQSIGTIKGVDKLENNKLGVNPLFVNAPSSFKLKPGSPANKAGTLKYGAPSNGTSVRPLNIDIGALNN